jgi:hypothetical protein
MKKNPQNVTDIDFLDEMTHKPHTIEDIGNIEVPEIPYNLNCFPELKSEVLWHDNNNMHNYLTLDFDFKPGFQKFILVVDDKFYLVDTQGYDYMRYIIEVI